MIFAAEAIDLRELRAVFQGITLLLFIPLVFSIWNETRVDNHANSFTPPRLYKSFSSLLHTFFIFLLSLVSFSIALVLFAIGEAFSAFEDRKIGYFAASFGCQVLGYCGYIVGVFNTPILRKVSWICSIITLTSMTTIIHFVLFDAIQDHLGIGFVLWGVSFFQIILIACFLNAPGSRRQCRECHNIGIYGSLLLFAAHALRLIDRYLNKVKGDQYLLIAMNVIGFFTFLFFCLLLFSFFFFFSGFSSHASHSGHFMIAFSSNKYSCPKLAMLDTYDSFDDGYVN